MKKGKRQRKLQIDQFRDTRDRVEVAKATRKSQLFPNGHVVYSLSNSGIVRQSMIVRTEEGPFGYHWNPRGKTTVEDFKQKYEALGFNVIIRLKPKRVNYNKNLRVAKVEAPSKNDLQLLQKVLSLRARGVTLVKIEETLDIKGKKGSWAHFMIKKAERLAEAV